MTSSTEPQSTEPVGHTPAVPLDEVMLAMDVVDTLRHQRAMVDASLDGERRERDLIERIKQIYASQGIEVADEVIAQGVEALEQDRFTYDAPDRTLSVRLAEIYVDRGKWSKRAAVCVAAIVVLWFAVTVPLQMHTRSQVEAFAGRLGTLRQNAVDLGDQAIGLRAELGAVGAAGVSAGAADILEGAARELDQIDVRVEALRRDLSPGPDPELYPDQQTRLDGTLEQHRETLAAIASGLGGVRGQVQAVARLASIGSSVRRVMARLDGLDVDSEVATELTRLRGRVDESVAAGDVEGARTRLRQLEQRVDGLVGAHELRLSTRTELQRQLSRLAGVEVEAGAARELAELKAGIAGALDAGEVDDARRDLSRLVDLVDVLDQSYELRILSRDGEQSGIWRRPPRGSTARNYYVIVEAVAADGGIVSLSVTNEENNETSSVRRFGVRVPEAVYEKVKADKLDNGLIDDKVFGVKKRGARAVDYRFEVAGGAITRW